MSDTRSNFVLVRCCWNCHYFKKQGANNKGSCSLPSVTDPKAKNLKAHGTCVCDAHTWKKNRHTVQRPAVMTGARLPDDAI